jgi:Tfp pilus assembly protein PilF
MKPKAPQKNPPRGRFAKPNFWTLLSIAVGVAGIALGIIQIAPTISGLFHLPGAATGGIMVIGLLVLVAAAFVVHRYRYTRKQGIALAVAGIVVFGAALFVLYHSIDRWRLAYYEDGRTRLFQPESTEEDYKWAVALFKQELERSSGNVPARAWLSIAQGLLVVFFPETNGHLMDEACANADKALHLDSNSAEARLAQARCAVLKNDENKADNELQAIEKYNPSDPMIWLGAAVTRQWLGQNDKATEYYERAGELAPEDARICLNYGHHLYELGEHDKSRKLLDKAIRRKPHSAYFAVVRAVAEISWTGNVQEAKRILGQLPENVNPECRVTAARCTLALYEGNFDAALNFVRKCNAKRVFSVDAGGLGGLDNKREAEGTILLFKGDPRAKDYLEPERQKYVDLQEGDQKSPEKNAALAVFDAWTGRKEEAIRHAEEAIRNLPEQGPRRKGVRLGVAKAYAWAGELERAWGQIDSYWAEFGGKTGMSTHNFRLDPSWTPMRNYPEFRRFVGQ